MIRADKLSYGVPEKELFTEISFEIKQGQHCALIGSNGTGKSTLVDIVCNPEKYLYDGEIVRDDACRIGYASQFIAEEKSKVQTVYEYLKERFTQNQNAIEEICIEMSDTDDMEGCLERYQKLLDLNEAMDADNHESNILKQLALTKMTDVKDVEIDKISGGEYKVLQIMREMLLMPNLLVLDEPDVFLDFDNIGNLCRMINSYQGTMLVITHNRYLLNHCFDKVLHLENGDLYEFEGTYTNYRCERLRETLELKRQHIEEEEEIDRTQEMVDILRKRATILVNPVIGRSVNAKQSHLDRLRDRHIDEPFIELREHSIVFPDVETEEEITVLSVNDYQIEFDKTILENVSFEIMAGEKAVIAGANGTGKTTLVRDIIDNCNPAIHIAKGIRYDCLSQLDNEKRSIYEIMLDKDFGNEDKMREYLSLYNLETADIRKSVNMLSVGEQNLFQIAMIAASDAQFLILDEPSSHLDLFAQMALEKAIKEYKGTVLLISHDFYLASSCADYVLYIDDNSMRKMKTRKFRKMVYDRYFDQKYLEIDRKKQEIENEITDAYRMKELERVEKLCSQLEQLSTTCN